MDIVCRKCGIKRRAEEDGTDWSEFPGEYLKIAIGHAARPYSCDTCSDPIRKGSAIWVWQSCPDDYFDSAEAQYLEKPYKLDFLPSLPERFVKRVEDAKS
ncbi:MAG TPA: hypothetical protein VE954_14840 [Oligoflexus sp.]|uniref:hypothetical protein n=1 Tax=Oligoflexus sp. TaxID=1971216 RepID=UPI002D2315A4|nr:hypothetical protein [Oligoflexus sp.]HYX34378.1 hypothetical protein [Oligoflexus sp.]